MNIRPKRKVRVKPADKLATLIIPSGAKIEYLTIDTTKIGTIDIAGEVSELRIKNGIPPLWRMIVQPGAKVGLATGGEAVRHHFDDVVVYDRELWDRLQSDEERQ